MNIPNALTLFRVILVPVFVLVFYMPGKWSGIAAGTIFALASITDWLDGYLARKLNQSTPLGAFLDPVADKLMVAVALVLLVSIHASPWFALMCAIIICREIVVSALREWMAELGKRTTVAVSYIGKIKTTMQMVAIIVLLVAHKNSAWLEMLGFVLLVVAALLTLWSMIIYLKAAWSELLAKPGQ